METTPSDTRSVRRRSDGERTHAAILDAAMRIASVEGLDGLTIGRLADQTGVSKSGVYAHFGSRQQLQLETVEAAQTIMEREVIAPALQAPPGVAQLEALAAAFLSYVERLVFPGGCFFASLLAEMDARSGPFHEMAQVGAREWIGLIAGMATDAQRNGQMSTDIDVEQFTFEFDASLELANYYYVLLGEPDIITRAQRSISSMIDRTTT